MDTSTKFSLVIVGGAIVLIAVAVFLYPRFTKKPSVPSDAPGKTAHVQKNNIGNALFEKSQNPIADKLPETNPFGANINPFEKVTNPLKTQYKNPFE